MHRLVTWLALSAVFTSPLPKEGLPTEWPLTRIVENLTRHLAEHPEDAAAHYNLGRASAFAFALDRSTVCVHGSGAEVLVLDLHRQGRCHRPKDVEPGRPLTAQERLDNLAKGVEHLETACALASEDAAFHLTRAWLLETGAPHAAELDSPSLFGLPAEGVSREIKRWVAELVSSDAVMSAAARANLLQPENLTTAVPLLNQEAASPRGKEIVAGLLERYWIERSISAYWRAFELAALEEERVSAVEIYELDKRVVAEAMDSLRKLLGQRGASEPEARRLDEAEKRLAELDKKPHFRWMTPLLLSLREGCPSLDELTTPNLTVPFDLDGDAIMEPWPWLAPDAGWLVWDPEQRGEITSGLQLFGSASAWLFFADGYRVLDALDDDRDGELRDAELTGIAVWFDRDTDGVSDPGEVVPVEELGLVALATEATEKIGPSLGNQGGAELADGRRLPTYDWVLSPARP